MAAAATTELPRRGSLAWATLQRLPSINPLWLVIAPAVLVVVGLLATVFWLSVIAGLPGTPDAHYTLMNFARLYGDSFVFGAMANTAGFALTAVIVALFFGISIAWLVERTDLPGKGSIYAIMSVGLLLPSYFLAMGWLFLMSPRIGVVNTVLKHIFGLAEAPFDVTSVWGMGWVQGLSLASLAFILTASAFRAMDPALEEAATVHGATFPQVVRRILVPLAFPGTLASAIYVFTIAIATFDVPAILGLSNRIYTFSTFVFSKSSTQDALPDYGVAAAMSVFMVAVAVAASLWYGRVLRRANQYQVVTGRGYRPRTTALGRWAIAAWAFIGGYLLLSKILPFLLVVWAATLPFFQPPSLQALATVSFKNFETIPFDLVGRGLLNTGVLVLAVPTLALLVCFAVSWMVVRSGSPLRGLLDFFAFLPHAVPGIIFGVGAVFATLFLIKGVGLYGTLALLVIVYVVDRLSFGTRVLNTALIQIHRELEESAAMCGASGLRIARSILTPLISPALLNAWLWMAIQTYRELTLATILFSPANIVLSVIIWNIWFSGKLGTASAITVLVLCGMIPLVLAYWALGMRRGPSERMASVP